MALSLARVAAVLLALPLAAWADTPGEPVQAVRRELPVVVDGRLDEPAWAAAPAFDGFVQRFPDEGAPPSWDTTVRVLFDDATLYVGVSCQDPEPARVQPALGPRDDAPFGDAVSVLVDSVRDGRTAFVFTVSAAGVQSDGLESEDDEYVSDWDAVWRGAASVGAEGWSAELAIPLAALRFADGGEPVFGFAVKRIVGRTHEEDLSIRVPRSARGLVPRLAPLLGLTGIAPRAQTELVPYAAARLTWAPLHQDDDARPRPRLFEPNADLGFDVRTTLGRGLSLQGTVNPDFGQVEADQVVQNLSTYELLFPEKRPFFTQGMDLFRPVAAQGRTSPQQMFYSRRIGLEAPILAAVKLSGSIGGSVQVGVVEAFVAGESAGGDEDHPDRRYRFSPARPLWFGPRAALPQRAPAPQNVLAAVIRWELDPRAALGATVTSALLAGPRCTGDESRQDDDHRPRRCDAVAGNAAALHLSLRSTGGEWFLRGQLTGSQALGGSPQRTFADGTQVRRGDVGLGAHVALGRAGGEPWRFELHWEYASPRLDVNAVGYQRTQNEQVGRAILRWVRPEGGGPFHSYQVWAMGEARFTTDGRRARRGGQLLLASEFQLRSFDWFGADAWLAPRSWDVREIDQSGVDQGRRSTPLALELPAEFGADAWISTDPSRPVVVEAGGSLARSVARGPLRAVPTWSVWANLRLRPHPRLETQLDAAWSRSAWPIRWVGDDGAEDPEERRFLFAELEAPALSVTLRQRLVLTPRLTLQAYAQLYSSSGRYRAFRVARARDGRIAPGDLGPEQDDPGGAPDTSAWWDNPDFRATSLKLSAVLRWEYRLGSTVFLVYSRSQREPEYPDDPHDPSPPSTLGPVRLGAGPTIDTVMVKWSYWWSR